MFSSEYLLITLIRFISDWGQGPGRGICGKGLTGTCPLSGLEVLEVVGEVIGGEGEGGGEAGGEEGTTELREAVALEGDTSDLLGEENLVGGGEDLAGDGHRLLVGGEEEEVAYAYRGSDG